MEEPGQVSLKTISIEFFIDGNSQKRFADSAKVFVESYEDIWEKIIEDEGTDYLLSWEASFKDKNLKIISEASTSLLSRGWLYQTWYDRENPAQVITVYHSDESQDQRCLRRIKIPGKAISWTPALTGAVLVGAIAPWVIAKGAGYFLKGKNPFRV